MASELYFLLTIAAGCSLLIVGIKMVSNNLLELVEVPIFNMIGSVRDHHHKTFFKGIFFSMISGSSLIASTTLLNLVNAGLMRSRAALLFLAGANLGPFLLLSLVIFLNLKVGLFFLSLSLVAQTLARTRIAHSARSLQRFLFGVGLICLAKYFLTDGIRIITGMNQTFLSSLSDGPFILCLFSGLFIGALLSYTLRSTLLSILLLMVIRDGTYISLTLLLPAVLGVHGVSFVAVRKISERGNIHAKRLGFGQMLLSLIGLIVGLILLITLPDFPYRGSSLYIIGFFALLRFVSVMTFAAFVDPINRFIKARIPDRAFREDFELEQLGHSRDMIPAMSILQCSFHVRKLKKIVDKLFNLTEEYLLDKQPSARVLAKIKDFERVTDNIHKEINQFTARLIENSLSVKQARSVSRLIKITDELEYIADYIDKLASYRTRYEQVRSEHEPDEQVVMGPSFQANHEELIQFFMSVKSFYQDITEDLPQSTAMEGDIVIARAQRLKITAEKIREEHLKWTKDLKETPMGLMAYSDMIVCLRKIRGHSLKIYNIVARKAANTY
jgi:Na+/phosphate symporter